jgi:hypothetical protein
MLVKAFDIPDGASSVATNLIERAKYEKAFNEILES